MENQRTVPPTDPQLRHVVQNYASRIFICSLQCLILQVPPTAEHPDSAFQPNMSTYQQGEVPTIQNCSCAQCSDGRRTQAGSSTWNPVRQQGHFGNAISPYLNQDQNVDSRAETTMIAPNHAQAQFTPLQFSGIQDNFGYAPVPGRAGPPNVGLLQAPILNAPIAEDRRRLAGRYLNNPDAYVQLVNSKSSSCLKWPTSSEAASKRIEEPNSEGDSLDSTRTPVNSCLFGQLVNVGSKPESIHRCGKKREYVSNHIAVHKEKSAEIHRRIGTSADHPGRQGCYLYDGRGWFMWVMANAEVPGAIEEILAAQSPFYILTTPLVPDPFLLRALDIFESSTTVKLTLWPNRGTQTDRQDELTIQTPLISSIVAETPTDPEVAHIYEHVSSQSFHRDSHGTQHNDLRDPDISKSSTTVKPVLRLNRGTETDRRREVTLLIIPISSISAGTPTDA
ncbi:hypothetical protein BJY52DRAFT_1421253 [Lactarius psammicola]|nr:hypothetical protein BJY52DRAFT_1421253 [Lactarius psammicola]